MSLVKIKMLSDKLGSPDGATVSLFEKDKEYDTTETLAASFEKEGVAERVAEEAPAADAPVDGADATTGKGKKKTDA